MNDSNVAAKLMKKRLITDYGKSFSLPHFSCAQINDIETDPIKFLQNVWGHTEKIYATVDVTRDLAKKWLDEQISNRKINKSAVKLYGEMMNKGKWQKLNPLHFDINGILCDGQHRLTAFLEKTTLPFITFYIIINLTKEDQCRATDGGLKRSLDFRLATYLGRKHSEFGPEYAKTINGALSYSIGSVLPLDKKSVPFEEATRIVDKYLYSLDWTMNVFKEVKGYSNIKKGRIISHLEANVWRAKEYYNSKKDEKNLKKFVIIAVGADTPNKSYEKWAWEVGKKLDEIRESEDKSKKLATHGDKVDRQAMYLFINECLYKYMEKMRHSPLKNDGLSSTERFPFDEEIRGLKSKEAEYMKRKKTEKEITRKKNLRKKIIISIPSEITKTKIETEKAVKTA